MKFIVQCELKFQGNGGDDERDVGMTAANDNAGDGRARAHAREEMVEAVTLDELGIGEAREATVARIELQGTAATEGVAVGHPPVATVFAGAQADALRRAV